MKITGQDPAKAAELTVGKGKGRESQRPGKTVTEEAHQPGSLPANANLTTHRVKEAIRNEPDVRAERVAELRQRIKEGTYRVDADEVAEKLLDNHLREDLERP